MIKVPSHPHRPRIGADAATVPQSASTADLPFHTAASPRQALNFMIASIFVMSIALKFHNLGYVK